MFTYLGGTDVDVAGDDRPAIVAGDRTYIADDDFFTMTTKNRDRKAVVLHGEPIVRFIDKLYAENGEQKVQKSRKGF